MLRDLIKPYLLRRLKKDVQKQLPQKTEEVLFCGLTPFQVRMYRKYLMNIVSWFHTYDLSKWDDRELSGVISMGVGKGSKKGILFKAITILRNICNHPDLLLFKKLNVKTVADLVGDTPSRESTDEEDDGLWFCFQINSVWKKFKKLHKKTVVIDPWVEELLQAFYDFKDPKRGDTQVMERLGSVSRSGKLKVFHQLLHLWDEQNKKSIKHEKNGEKNKKISKEKKQQNFHRVLVFSQRVQMLNILEKYLQKRKFRYLRMDGTTPIPKRQAFDNPCYLKFFDSFSQKF